MLSFQENIVYRYGVLAGGLFKISTGWLVTCQPVYGYHFVIISHLQLA